MRKVLFAAVVATVLAGYVAWQSCGKDDSNKATTAASGSCQQQDATTCGNNVAPCSTKCSTSAAAQDPFQCPCGCWNDFKSCMEKAKCSVDDVIKKGQVKEVPGCSCQSDGDCATAIKQYDPSGVLKTSCAQNNICKLQDAGSLGGTGTAGGSILENITQVAADCAISKGGAVYCWGNGGDPTAVQGLSGVTAITAGGQACALLATGTVRCWYQPYGRDPRGPLLDVPGLAMAKAIGGGVGDAGGVCAVLYDGTLKCWGMYSCEGGKCRSDITGEEIGSYEDARQKGAVTIPGVTGAVDLGVSGRSEIYVVSGSSRGVKLVAANVAQNISRMVDVMDVSGLSGVVAISANRQACALLSDGTVKCWEDAAVGVLGDGKTKSSRPYEYRGVDTPVPIPGLNGIVSIGVNFDHACAVSSNGAAYCWGKNTFGQLGDGTTVDRTTPVNVSSSAQFASIWVSYDHSCAVTSKGEAQCWGGNNLRQLGDGTTQNRSTPVSVIAPK